MNSIPLGKLPADLLREMLDKYVPVDSRVVIGPGIGQDAAVIDMGDRYLVAKTDPITFAADEIGWYAVNVNANDVACCGATPRWFLATLLLPELGTTPQLVESIFAQLSDACRELGVTLCGGHTEITYALDRPIVVGQMLGEVAPENCITAGGAQIGDAVILTKGIAVEGTALIARERPDALKSIFSSAEIERCADFLHNPGISVVREAQTAMQVGGVHAFHDPTEGGLATGLWELAQAAGVGLLIEESRIPILPECRRMCEHFGLAPLGLIGSGALLIAAESSRADTIVQRLQSDGIPAAVIGTALPADQGCSLRKADGTTQLLPQFDRDEITRFFA